MTTSKPTVITHTINDTILKLLENSPAGIRWTDLNKQVKELHPDFHPKTINGCVWKLVERFPETVYKPSKGLFRLTKYKNRASNKTIPTDVSVDNFLKTISSRQQDEAHTLISMMSEVSGETPLMWGPSIIGFGTRHYKYETGREGDIPRLAFSPRKSAITIYFYEGFDRYSAQLSRLGKHKQSVSCLYINKLADVDLVVLKDILTESFASMGDRSPKPATPEQYIAQVPPAARARFDELRKLVRSQLPDTKEVLSYGILGYKTDDKRARVFISGWKDHVAMYPIPKDPDLTGALAPYAKGKGTLWFALDEPLPAGLIKEVVRKLTK